MNAIQDTLLTVLAQTGLSRAQLGRLRPEIPLNYQEFSPQAVDALSRHVARSAGDWPDMPPSPSLDDFAARLAQAVPHHERVRKALEAIREGWREVAPGQEYVIDRLRESDAPYVAQLFSVVYGDKYPVADYYEPESLVRLNRQERVFTFVARLADGSVAGQCAFLLTSAPNPGFYEFGQALILHPYRRSSMAMNLSRFMHPYSFTIKRAQGFFGEAVTNHPVTQRMCLEHGYTVCGFEASLMPTGAYGREGAGDTRMSVVLAARVDRDQHRELHLPEVYRSQLTGVLEEFKLDRAVAFHETDSPMPGPSRLEDRVFDFAQVVRIQAHSVGEDFSRRMDEFDARSRAQNLAVSQVYLNVGQPGAAHAVEHLRRRGYFFGGLLPIWFGTDGLLMQKLAAPPILDGLVLHTRQAQVLFEAARADWERASRQG